MTQRFSRSQFPACAEVVLAFRDVFGPDVQVLGVRENDVTIGEPDKPNASPQETQPLNASR